MPKGSFIGGLVPGVFGRLPRELLELALPDRATAPVVGESVLLRPEIVVEELARDLNSAEFSAHFTSDFPSARLKVLLLNASPRRRFALVTLAIRHSYDLRLAPREIGLAYVGLALLALRRSAFSGFSPEILFDLGARALVVRGNFKRLASRLAAAQTDFNRARFMLRNGTHDPIELAFLQRLEASLLIDRGDFAAARRHLGGALRTYRRFGHCDLPAVLLGLGIAALHSDDHPGAQALFEEALDLPSQPNLILAAHHNFTLSLVYQGRPREALSFFLANRDLRESLAPASYRHRSAWLAGLIYSELEWLEQAEESFSAARQGFLEPPLPYELAKVSAELALVRFQKGRPEEVRGLLEPILPYLFEEKLLVDARAALLLLLRAEEAQALSLGALQDLVGYLRRREYNPGTPLPAITP